MIKGKALMLSLLSPALLVCAPSHAELEQKQLLNFAHVNCLFNYMKSKGYETEDLRTLSAGIVEKSTLDPEKFVHVHELVKSYESSAKYKAEVDTNLTKCFEIPFDKNFAKKIEEISLTK
ncbi:exported hypothetical protein [Vibrio nigripulchritudo SO65]|nr:exported hypothetical protein [Vibrio nigripulchritudo AM115]CCN41003.1 exported hypothetical protein [Vibrio nigripulchritudo FTn2]CCN67824.1 exported hypothetical protein [Vibrio nigripulchritudo POn4]CCN79401.1 exported hypothetical protein [Vibrio nigripulchritudo SO65]